MSKPLMAKATAVWLVDNTTISFKQIADFCDLHELEVQGIADGDVATGVKGFDPIANNQLVQEEIDAAEKNPLHKLKLKHNPAAERGREASRSALHTAFQAPGSPCSYPLAGQVSSRIERWPGLKACGYDQTDYSGDPRTDHWNISSSLDVHAALTQPPVFNGPTFTCET